ncbi:MAG: TVP38/TMEM64 family protein [Pseudomonadota bacterium]
MEFLTDAHPAVFIFVTVAATMAFLPGSITMTLAGLLYGFWPGFLFAAMATAMGAQGAFAVGRRLLRPWILKRADANPKLRALEKGLEEEGFTIVALSRLSLVVPFNVFNYICGASPVRAKTYFAATVIGMIPALVLYVYLGTLARDIGQVLAGESTPSELSWWLFGFGVFILLVLVLIVRRVAMRALEKHLDIPEESTSAP